jgi:hypothetical protein
MITRLFAILAFVCLATQVHAQGWSAAGTACVPSGDTIGKYENVTAAGVHHLNGRVGTLIFTCSIQPFDTAVTNWALRLAYRDSTGTAPGAAVGASLYQMAKGTFAPASLKSVTSNSSASTGKTVVSSTALSHTFDFDANVYFVQVTITRTATNQLAQFHSVWLEAP